jgi:hypothetical protein
VNTMVRSAPMASRTRLNTGRASRSVLDMRAQQAAQVRQERTPVSYALADMRYLQRRDSRCRTMHFVTVMIRSCCRQPSRGLHYGDLKTS